MIRFPYHVSIIIANTVFLLITASAFVVPPPTSIYHKPKPFELRASSSSSSGEFDTSELSLRIQSIKSADKLEESFDNSSIESSVSLPVVSFDALLPNQRLSGSTTDPTFSRLLQHLGIGGLFVMTSLNHSKRMLRRNGVVARIEVVDAPSSSSKNTSSRIPTAVDFSVVGRRRCRLIGPSCGMSTRVGRWRRVYDSDGEESMLGWGDERFVDALPHATSIASSLPAVDNDTEATTTTQLVHTDWSTNPVDFALVDADYTNKTVINKAESVIVLLDKWQALASNTRTYENVNVVATARLLKDQPILRVDPEALLRNVKRSLGEIPPPTDPSALAFWGAALINPLPALGVAPEIRGRVLEAPDAYTRLEILEWGISRSIRNLEGSSPL